MKKIFLVFTFIFVLINNAFTQQKLESVSEKEDYSYLIYKYDLKPDFSLINENELINVGSSYKPTQDWFFNIEPIIIENVKDKDEIYFGYSQINFLDLESYLNYKNYHETLSEQITKNINNYKKQKLQEEERVKQWQKIEKERNRKKTVSFIASVSMLIGTVVCVVSSDTSNCSDCFYGTCDSCNLKFTLGTTMGAFLGLGSFCFSIRFFVYN